VEEKEENKGKEKKVGEKKATYGEHARKVKRQ
jgi:hypothetical protein